MGFMGFFDIFKQADINQAVKDFLALQTVDQVSSLVSSTDTPLFVYCHSGARSRQASCILQSMGYTNVNNIGGIAAYSGKVEQ